MTQQKIFTVIGLMSGTSLDGIDAAVIRTDGEHHIEPLDFINVPYEPELRQSLRSCLGKRTDDDPSITDTGTRMTQAHAHVVQRLAEQYDVDLTGFHGQTIFHDPAEKFTWQIGDGSLLAQLTGIDVINDFRTADVETGGEGAPFLPLYHQARIKAAERKRPRAILNIGGVANVTWIGPGGDENILAFDTGPGNALIDDFINKRKGLPFDQNGDLARSGKADEGMIQRWLENPFFTRLPPKSLDRDEWETCETDSLSDEDGVATLTLFTVESIAKALDHMPEAPSEWYVTGGGRKNKTMMDWLADRLSVSVQPVENIGWNGDALEAEGFAYLAVRSLRGLPLSLPSTTGVPAPVTGGVFHAANIEKKAAVFS